MNRWLKLGMLAATLAVVALTAFGASAFAQGPAPQGSPPTGQPGYGMGYGMGLGRLPPGPGSFAGGGGWGGPQNSLVAVSARVIGISQADLVTALNGGKTIADVAKEKGVATSKIVDEFLAPRVTALKSAVEAKRLTQDQADTLLKTMKDNVTQQLNNKFTPRGSGMGFVDANQDGICDYCGQHAPVGGQFGPRGRWSR